MPLILLLLLLLDSNEIKWRANGDFKLQYWRFQKGESIHFWHLFNILFASPRKGASICISAKRKNTSMHATYCSFQVKWTLVAVKHQPHFHSQKYWLQERLLTYFLMFLAQYFITSKLLLHIFKLNCKKIVLKVVNKQRLLYFALQ